MNRLQPEEREKRQWAIWVGLVVALVGFAVIWLTIDFTLLVKALRDGIFGEGLDWEAFGWNAAFVVSLFIVLYWMILRKYKFTYYYIAAFVLRLAYAIVYTTIDVTRIQTETDFNYSVSLNNAHLFRVCLMAFFIVFLLTSKRIKANFAKEGESGSVPFFQLMSGKNQ